MKSRKNASLQQGADFYSVAQEKAGQDRETTMLGAVTADSLLPELSQDVFDAKLNQIVGPINSEFGWHILKVVKITPKQETPLASVKSKIINTLRQEQAYDVAFETIASIEDAIGAGASLTDIANQYGAKLNLVKGLKEATSLGVLINHQEVISIDYLDNGFSVKTTNNQYETKTVLLATGKSRNSFSLAKPYEGKGISYCATCDGFFYKNKKIGIVGYNNYMLHELNYLKPLTNDITIFTNGNELEVEVDNKVIKDKIVALNGEDKLESVTVGNEIIKLDGLFIALGSQNAFTLAKHLGLMLNKEDLVVDNNYMTNIPGIFAAGDVIGGMLQVVKAASDGARAAEAINKYLRGLK